MEHGAVRSEADKIIQALGVALNDLKATFEKGEIVQDVFNFWPHYLSNDDRAFAPLYVERNGELEYRTNSKDKDKNYKYTQLSRRADA